MIQGKTKSGFEYSIAETAGNDYELVEQLAELEENPLILAKIVVKVLGKQQANALKNHLRNEDGIVPSDAMMSEISEIFTSGGNETKNS